MFIASISFVDGIAPFETRTASAGRVEDARKKNLCGDLGSTTRMAALTGNFGFVAASVFTRLAAVFVVGIATARNVCALFLVGLCHRFSSISHAHSRRNSLVAGIPPQVACKRTYSRESASATFPARGFPVESALSVSKVSPCAS
jgi:hypothetical protein